VLIALGDLSVLGSEIPGGLRNFLERGGAVLAASDRETPEGFLAALGVGIDGDKVHCDAPTPQMAYLGLRECPIVQPVREAAGQSTPFDALTSVHQGVATNRPSHLVLSQLDPGLREVGLLPPGCSYYSEQPLPFLNRGQLSFAVAGQVGRGRLLILADHSIFINDLMQRANNGNREFALNSLTWLMATEGGNRREVLFVEDGSIQTDLQPELQHLSSAMMPTDIPFAPTPDQVLAKLQEDNLLNDLIEGWRAPRWMPTALVLVATALLVGWGLMRIQRARARFDPAVPLLSTAMTRTLPTKILTVQRHQEMVTSCNLWEAARVLGRQFLAAVGVTSLQEQPPLRCLRVDGPWWQRWQLRRQFLILWLLATDSVPRRITPRRFERLLRNRNDLLDAFEEGKLQLVQDALPEEQVSAGVTSIVPPPPLFR
jgi:hypothetical protein